MCLSPHQHQHQHHSFHLPLELMRSKSILSVRSRLGEVNILIAFDVLVLFAKELLLGLLFLCKLMLFVYIILSLLSLMQTYVLDVHPFNPRIAMSSGYDGKTIIWDVSLSCCFFFFSVSFFCDFDRHVLLLFLI